MAARKSKGRGRPKLTGDCAPVKMLGVRCRRGFLTRLDKWRQAQGEKPSQAEAMKLLADAALTKAGF